MLPEKFEERMKKLLGEDYPKFSAALEEAAVRGVRVNEAKISTDDYKKISKLSLSPIEYAHDGFIPDSADGVGSLAEHHAGMIYVQDPGAMATVNAIDIKRGWRVLDACSAPGGKSSQIASRIGDEGFLLSNEYVPKRAKIIVSNFERLGIKNAMVVSQDTAKFSEMFDSYFDLVLCDAPCSGEGMFRKYDAAITEWSEENVLQSAKRQREILDNLAGQVRRGGYLLYSTCTYSPEENEENIAYFLKKHEDYRLVPTSERLLRYTADGLPTDGLSAEESRMCRRFYPHIAKGEGQFVALMQRTEAPDGRILYKDEATPPSKSEARIVEAYFKETMKSKPDGRIIKQSNYVVLVPHSHPIPKYSVFMAGVIIGEIKGDRLLPHHQFFSAYGRDMLSQENLKAEDLRVSAYLRGEEIEARAAQGWCSVLYEGVPLGGGKASGGKIKNHYPKGLRNK
jgi:NOL1/NOP2/sun family putative RNA methylase